MAANLVQSNEGTSTVATTTASFATATTAGNLVVLCFAADDYNATPGAGWTQSNQMEQQTFHGAYIWWRISTGETNYQYVIASATNSSWVLEEWSGLTATPYDTSLGQFAASSAQSYTTPALTPTSGERLLVAMIGGSDSTGTDDLSTDTVSWTNSFTHDRSSGPATFTGTGDKLGVGYRTVTADGVTTYSTGATYDTGGAQTMQSTSGLIIAFIVAAAGGTFKLGDYVLDSGLNGLKSACDKVYICSGQPTDFTDATTTKALGNKNWGAGSAFGSPAAGTGGRQISSIAITNGSVTANGTVAAWAAVDSANSLLLASGPLTGGVAVTSGQVFTLSALTFTILRS